MSCHRGATLAVLVGLAIGFASVAHADTPTTSQVREASRHFQRGVTLYNETDYRGALVEFQRAYEIAPNSAVLYNIGQTYFQLQNYAAALATLDRYLAEAGANAAHRSEVEATIDTLQSRVGKVAVLTAVADVEIVIDDEAVGKTPFREPLLVSVGRRKVTAMRDGRVAETRFIDVAAGDTVQLQLQLNETAPRPLAPSDTPGAPSGGGTSLTTVGWYTTGFLAAGAVVGSGVALFAWRDLRNTRNSFPTTADDLDSKSSKLRTWSTIADALWVATAVTGGVTLVFTLTKSKSSETRLAIVPNGIQLVGAFQ